MTFWGLTSKIPEKSSSQAEICEYSLLNTSSLTDEYDLRILQGLKTTVSVTEVDGLVSDPANKTCLALVVSICCRIG
jgi:hypothetical protein